MSTLYNEDILKIASEKNDFIIDYGDFSTELMKEESIGIKKLFIFLLPFLTVIQNGGVLMCDEIETGLHESIVAKLLEIFLKLYPENNAQLLFTTHDTSLLNIDLFRRDQIWFTELNQSRATDLYSLVEIRNVRKNEDLKNGYVSGKYGAIPTLDINFMQKLQEFKYKEE